MINFSSSHLNSAWNAALIIVRLSQILSFIGAIAYFNEVDVEGSAKRVVVFIALLFAVIVYNILIEGWLIILSAAINYLKAKQKKQS